MRLLTEVEIAGVCGRFSRPENRKQGLHLLAEMAANEEHTKTLKAVGERLTFILDNYLKHNDFWNKIEQDAGIYLHGEMPEEDK